MRTWALAFLLTSALFAESVAGLKWTMPQGWKTEGARQMRAATYSMPLASGDQGQVECAVYFFGMGNGGSIQANIDRWRSQFQNGGKEAEAKVDKRTIHNLPVTTIESSGDYMGMGGPNAQSPSAVHNYKLFGAIVEGPGGNVFIKFTGPAKTVEANRKQFEALLNSFQKE
jgi:hypothetical protein